MIDLYYAATPNGYKIKLFLKKLGWNIQSIQLILAKVTNLRPIF